MTHPNSFGSRATLEVDGRTYTIFRLDALSGPSGGNAARLPVSLKILLENLLRNEDGAFVKSGRHRGARELGREAARSRRRSRSAPRACCCRTSPAFPPSSISPPCATRSPSSAAIRQRINPLQPVDLVIDHSVQVDEYGTDAAFLINAELEFERNQRALRVPALGPERVQELPRRAARHRHLPPGEPRVPRRSASSSNDDDGERVAYPDSLVGTDSHTTMINGLGVLGWGVGGIEAEAAMLGQPVSMLIPEVVGFKLHGKLPAGATATDLVLTVTEMLRKKKVVGKFVEFYGDGLSSLSLADRATIANMAPEYGATMGFFPVDDETLKYLRFTGRDEQHVALVEAYCKAQGLFRTDDTPDPVFTDTLELDLATVEPSHRRPAAAAGSRAAHAGEADVPRGARGRASSKPATSRRSQQLKEANAVSAQNRALAHGRRDRSRRAGRSARAASP